MSGFDYLGADGLAGQYIVVHVKNVDTNKLRSKLGGSKGQLASSALTFVDAAPKAALDAAIPFLVGKAKDYGVTAEVSTVSAPPGTSRALSEFWPGLGIGVVLGGSLLGIYKLVSFGVGRLIGR